MIAIKNMNMPDRCGCCPLAYIDEYGAHCKLANGTLDEEYFYSNSRPDDCPLIEIGEED